MLKLSQPSIMVVGKFQGRPFKGGSPLYVGSVMTDNCNLWLVILEVNLLLLTSIFLRVVFIVRGVVSLRAHQAVQLNLEK